MFPQLSDKLQEIFKDLRGHGVISESNVDAALRQVRMALLEADVDFQVARKFIARVKEKALGEECTSQHYAGSADRKNFPRRIDGAARRRRRAASPGRYNTHLDRRS